MSRIVNAENSQCHDDVSQMSGMTHRHVELEPDVYDALEAALHPTCRFKSDLLEGTEHLLAWFPGQLVVIRPRLTG